MHQLETSMMKILSIWMQEILNVYSWPMKFSAIIYDMETKRRNRMCCNFLSIWMQEILMVSLWQMKLTGIIYHMETKRRNTICLSICQFKSFKITMYSERDIFRMSNCLLTNVIIKSKCNDSLIFFNKFIIYWQIICWRFFCNCNILPNRTYTKYKLIFVYRIN